MSVFKPDFNKSLKSDFFLNDTETVAKELLGKVLVKQLDSGEILAGIITETEAYLSENDLASHSATGKSQRNAPMFEEGGIIYVYKIYGIHHCLNIVTETAGKGCAVLIRGILPLIGIDKMKELRGIENENKLCNGPGKIAKAFSFDRGDNYKKIITKKLFVQPYENKVPANITRTKRIGITKSTELELRFLLKI
ncbi:MAG: DNA-3-methyladenine glycosylase [Ignavibacteriae bacterium]|nr:DNA-3-methyladenine glycosylase [Ignavibacteriota bacterium]